MKENSASLGALGTKFFALMQMKNKEIVRLGEVQPYLKINATQEKKLLQKFNTFIPLLIQKM